MHHKTGADRNQVQIFSLEEKVEKEALVRVIDAFVDKLDLEAMGFHKRPKRFKKRTWSQSPTLGLRINHHVRDKCNAV